MSLALPSPDPKETPQTRAMGAAPGRERRARPPGLAGENCGNDSVYLANPGRANLPPFGAMVDRGFEGRGWAN
jgi:hypothetical protein